MNHTQLIESAAKRMGTTNHEEAERAIAAVLITLGETLRRRELPDVAAALSPDLAALLCERACPRPRNVCEFVARVAQREGVSQGFALEHSQAVLDALSNALGLAARERLRADVWPDLLVPTLRGR
jgi:uncharacterized protein (DUF2267 family)